MFSFAARSRKNLVYAIGRPAVVPPHPRAVSKSIVYPPRQVNALRGFHPFLHFPLRYPACSAEEYSLLWYIY